MVKEEIKFYIRSKSRTGRKPRTGNRYVGSYGQVLIYDEKLNAGTPERIFLLVGKKTKGGKQVLDVAVFNSPLAAKKAGWVVIS